jgi:hypothetical protein
MAVPYLAYGTMSPHLAESYSVGAVKLINPDP